MSVRFQLPKLPLRKRLLPSRMGNGVDWYMPYWWCYVFGGDYPYGWQPSILARIVRNWKNKHCKNNVKHHVTQKEESHS